MPFAGAAKAHAKGGIRFEVGERSALSSDQL